MSQNVAHAKGQDDWGNVPEVIKEHYTHEQWMWLSDDEKARLIQTETEPDTYED